MMEKQLTLEQTIFEIGNKYADSLGDSFVNHSPHAPGSDGVSRHRPGSNLPHWNNPENIDSGKSGFVLLLMELYDRHPDARYLEIIDQGIDNLLIYCRHHPTHNYSLYAGRAGVAYVLIRRFRMGGDERLIHESLEIIRQANDEYLHAGNTSDYLYDGRAGTLLVILELYKISKKAFLLTYIEQFVRKIIGNAQFSRKGVCWHGPEELNLEASCGFAFGTAGIQYVFEQLNQFCPSDAITFVLDEIERFTESCWREPMQNWGDSRKCIADKETLWGYKAAYLAGDPALFCPEEGFSWAYGTAGILFAALPGQPGAGAKVLLEKLKRALLQSETPSASLFDGKAGIALYLLQLQDECGGYALQKTLLAMADALTANPGAITPDGGLMHGESGMVYCLLRSTAGPKRTENILIPFLSSRFTSPCSAVPVPLELAEVRKECIAKSFPRLTGSLEAFAQQAFRNYLERPYLKQDGHELTWFVKWAAGIASSNEKEAGYECIADVLYLEKERLCFYEATKKSSFQSHLENAVAYEKRLENLNRPDEWLLNQTWAIAGDVRFVKARRAWHVGDEGEGLRKITLPEPLPGSNDSSKEYETLLQPACRLEHVEIRFETPFSQFLHFFDEPKVLKNAIAEMKQCLMAWPEAELMGVIKSAKLPGTYKATDFFAILESQGLSVVKKYIFKGVVVMVL